jgi:hypothetical protein
MNNKLEIYEPKEIQKVIDFLTIDRNIISISELDGVSTITVTDTILLYDGNSTYLAPGMYVQIDNINYKVSNVIANTSFDITATGLTADTWALAFEFRFGTRTEVNKLLDIASKQQENKLTRFPLLWMIIDGTNQRNNDFPPPIDFESTAKFAMINLTDLQYTAEQRLDNNFIPTLQPYVTLFKNTLKSAYFNKVFFFENKEFANYQDWYRYFYGSTDKNQMVFDAVTDAIEFQTDLRYNEQFCSESEVPAHEGRGLGSMFIIS